MNHSAQYHYPHINLLIPAQINYHGRTFSATVGSLTPEGALLETHALSLPIGMEIELSFTLGRRHWPIKSVITHTTPHEIGVLFKHTQHKLFAAAHDDLPLSFRPTAKPLPEPVNLPS